MRIKIPGAPKISNSVKPAKLSAFSGLGLTRGKQAGIKRSAMKSDYGSVGSNRQSSRSSSK